MYIIAIAIKYNYICLDILYTLKGNADLKI